MFFIPFIAALLGGGVVVAVIAAFGDLGETSKSVTTVQAAPIAPSNASQQSNGLTPHDIYVKDAPGVVFRDLDDRAENGIAVQPLRRRRNPAPGPGDRLGHRDRPERHDPHQLPRRRERDQGHGEPGKGQDGQRAGRRQGPVQRSRGAAHPSRRPGAAPAHARRLQRRAGRRPGARDRQPVRPRTHAHDGRHLGAAASDHGAERLHDRQRAADRRADQPRQLGRPAARRLRPRDRHQLADRDGRLGRRQRRHRLRRADRHGQVRDLPAGERRDGPRRVHRADLADDRRLAVGAQPAGEKRRARAERAERHPRRKGRHQRRHGERQHRRRPGRGRRRHRRLDRRQGGQQLRRPLQRHLGQETRRHRHGRVCCAATAKAATNTSRSASSSPAAPTPFPTRALRKGRTPLPLGACLWRPRE